MNERDKAILLAQAIQDFWARQGRRVEVRVVEHYSEWMVRTNLTGREPCQWVKTHAVVDPSRLKAGP